MALSRTFNLLVPSLLTKCNSANVIRHYSIFPKNYVKPIYRKEEQNELYQSGEIKTMLHQPIIPAYTTDTSSEFYDKSVNKFINYILKKGNKALARSLLEKTFEIIKITQLERYNKAPPEQQEQIILEPKEIFHRAIVNCTPVLDLVKMRRGGILYQVPVPINERRANFLAMNWLIKTAKEKDGSKRFYEVLAKDLIDASNNQGRVVKKKQELHRQCEANRAYAHFRWLKT